MNLTIPAMSSLAIAAVTRFEDEALKLPQIEIETMHALHAGVYTRTMRMPKHSVVTGALVKIDTVLTIAGDAWMTTEEGPVRLTGYHVLTAAAGRKQAFVAIGETYVTMTFATCAATIEQAEEEFTDDAHRLLSRKQEK